MLTLESLEDVAVALVRQRPRRPRSVDFDLLARILDVPSLPSDYRELARAYPSMEIDGFLRVWLPVPGDENDFGRHLREELGMLSALAGDDLTYGYEAHPAPCGLIPWGESLHGDTFFWRVSDRQPDIWPVVVGSRSHEWWEFRGGVIAFLVGLIDGTLERRGLPEDVPRFPARVHLFVD
jgi:hypothetical protein